MSIAMRPVTSADAAELAELLNAIIARGGTTALQQAFTPERVSAATGLTLEQLTRFAETIAQGKRVSFWWTMGVNQSHEGTRTAQAIINLALITGNMGRPGTGVVGTGGGVGANTVCGAGLRGGSTSITVRAR